MQMLVVMEMGLNYWGQLLCWASKIHYFTYINFLNSLWGHKVLTFSTLVTIAWSRKSQQLFKVIQLGNRGPNFKFNLSETKLYSWPTAWEWLASRSVSVHIYSKWPSQERVLDTTMDVSTYQHCSLPSFIIDYLIKQYHFNTSSCSSNVKLYKFLWEASLNKSLFFGRNKYSPVFSGRNILFQMLS